jgi:D-glycero-D-manno-heptose 1,7-bisphosphate phosphatase
MMASLPGRRAVFLDRDGVLNDNRVPYITRRADFRWLPGAREALALLALSPYAVVLITNQSAVGRGLLTRARLDELHAALLADVVAAGGRLDGIFVCPHLPDAGCPCRKPAPGLLYEAAAALGLDLARSYFIGDAVSDIEAARAAGCEPILVLTGHGAGARRDLEQRGRLPRLVAPDLLAAVCTVLRDTPS